MKFQNNATALPARGCAGAPTGGVRRRVPGSTEVDGPIAEKIRRAKLKHSFQLVRVKGRHR